MGRILGRLRARTVRSTLEVGARGAYGGCARSMAVADSADNEDEGPDVYEDADTYEDPGTYELVVPEDDDVNEGPSDVFLDVPTLHLDELGLEVEDLRARVSLQAEVLDLLKLNVGADVQLGRVQLDIKGVDVQAQLKVRLHNVANILARVLETVDRNPQILEQLTRGVGAAVEEVGSGTGRAVGELGEGAGAAVEEVGEGAGGAVEEVGRGAGSAVEDVGEGAGSAVEDVGEGAGSAVDDVGQGAGAAAENVAEGAGAAVEDVGRGAGSAADKAGGGVADVAGGADDVVDGARKTVDDVGEGAGKAVTDAGEDAGAAGTGDSVERAARPRDAHGRGKSAAHGDKSVRGDKSAHGEAADNRRSGRKQVRAAEVGTGGDHARKGRAPIKPRRRPTHRRER
ncbi:hypothetical protein ACIP6P_20025 [Streptomyces sp. NPDC088729]|uniref:hypothetical protein n=1 Tax=Streptomyces sp. NPDC088729 TaxID=3365876 RepID=UPI0037F132F7